jgi:hypothetical protein
MKRPVIFSLLLLAGMVMLNSCIEDEIPKITETKITADITKTTSWTADKEYVIDGNICVGDGAVLTIAPGTVIKFTANSSLSFGCNSNATIIAKGTAAKPIVFTSSAIVPTAGSWQGLTFYDKTLQNSLMRNCIVEYAGAINQPAIRIIECNIAIDSCVVRKVSNEGIYVTHFENKGGFTSFDWNTFTEIGKHDLRISPNMVHVIGVNNNFSKSVQVEEQFSSSTPRVWKKINVPYVLPDGLTVDGDLTIEAGNVFRFGANAYLYVGYYSESRFVAHGTPENPVLFTSSAANATAGAWHGIVFGNHTLSNTSMKYCIIEYTGKDAKNAVEVLNGINFTNNIIRHHSGIAIGAGQQGYFKSFYDNDITATGHVIKISSLYLPTLGVPNTLKPGNNKGIFVYDDAEYAQPVTWKKQENADFYMDNNVDVNGSLTLEPGSVFKFGADGFLSFGYHSNTTLIAKGTTTQPIIFTSAASTPAAAAWSGLEFYDGNVNTDIAYIQIYYGGKGNVPSLHVLHDTTVKINNSSIFNHGGTKAPAAKHSTAVIQGNSGNSFAWFTYN